MALKLSDLIKKSIEKGYGHNNINIEKPWTQGCISNKDLVETRALITNKSNKLLEKDIFINNLSMLPKLDKSNNKVVTNNQESDNKVVTNNQESDNKVVTNNQESDNKVVTNNQESDNKVVTNNQESDNKVVTNNQESDNKVVTNNQESDNKVVTNNQESDNKVVTNNQESNNKVVTNNQESNNKVNTEYENNLHNDFTDKNNKTYLTVQLLSGVQLAIFNKILDMKVKISKEYYTHVNTTKLASEMGLSTNTLRVSLERIINKKIIIRKPGVMGRNGLSKFKIPNQVLKYKNEIEQNKKVCSKHNNNNTITTISLKENIQISSETGKWWEKLNLLPLEKYGFKHAQFQQLSNLNQPEVIQESINHFAWGLEFNPKNEKYKNNPSRILISILKKGCAWIEDGYKDPQEIAMEKLIEVKNKSMVRKKKLEEEVFLLDLEEWISLLSSDDIEKIAPKKIKNDLTPQKSRLNKYFKENIWSKKPNI